MNKSLVGVCRQSNTHGVDTLLSAQLLSQPTTCRSPIPYTNRSFHIASADMFAPEQMLSDTMPVVDMACMCFTESDTSFVQVDVSSSMVCLVMAGTIFDCVLPFAEA